MWYGVRLHQPLRADGERAVSQHEARTQRAREGKDGRRRVLARQGSRARWRRPAGKPVGEEYDQLPSAVLRLLQWQMRR